MNIENKSIISEINKKYLELGKFEESIHIVRNMWLPLCVTQYLEERVNTLKLQIDHLEKSLEK